MADPKVTFTSGGRSGCSSPVPASSTIRVAAFAPKSQTSPPGRGQPPAPVLEPVVDKAQGEQLTPLAGGEPQSAAKQKKLDAREERLANLSKVWADVEMMEYSPADRHALRPWYGELFENRVQLTRQRALERQKGQERLRLEARSVFMKHLDDTYGNRVRAWRRVLDPSGTYEVSEATLRRYCRQNDLPIDSAALWKALDRDSDGKLFLEAIWAYMADLMASFRQWATQAHGSCVKLWDMPQVKALAPNPCGHLSVKIIAEALQKTSCRVPKREVLSMLHCLDFHGCGFLCRADFTWLDEWQPSEWLSSRSDPEAWEELRAAMLRMYDHPLRAWRCLLDKDNSNSVSWDEFSHACDMVKFTGNRAGAWRVLDSTLEGCISMADYDPPSAELLKSFKDFADANFGSVRKAFQALDEDASGSLEYKELRKGCARFDWKGDVRLLFECLDTDHRRSSEGGRRFVTLKEMVFLDGWGSDRLVHEEEVHVPRRSSAADRKRCHTAEGSMKPEATYLPDLYSRGLQWQADQKLSKVSRTQQGFHTGRPHELAHQQDLSLLHVPDESFARASPGMQVSHSQPQDELGSVSSKRWRCESVPGSLRSQSQFGGGCKDQRMRRVYSASSVRQTTRGGGATRGAARGAALKGGRGGQSGTNVRERLPALPWFQRLLSIDDDTSKAEGKAGAS